MAKRYTQDEKEYMAKMAIKIVRELDKDYPSFKNYIWAAQNMIKGKEIANGTDQVVYDVLKSMD